VELARIRLAESQERTAQSGEETARLRVLQQIIETQAATARQSLELLQWGLESGNVAIPRAGLTPQNLTDLEADFSAELGRQRELEPYAEQLAEINPTDMSRLTSRVRPMVQEVALPLRRSASSFTLSDPANDNVLAFFDSQRAQALSERESLEEPIRLTCKIKAYDREIGVGKLRSTELTRVLNFIVPSERRPLLLNKILTAMARDEVVGHFLAIVDASGEYTSLILLDLDGATDESVNDDF
jgi:hypothetical protein